MKVFVIMGDVPHEFSYVAGIYFSRAVAERHCARLSRDSDAATFTIDEHVVDLSTYADLAASKAKAA